MQKRLAAGKTVMWTTNLRFKREGIQYRPKGLIGRKEMQLLPYSECSGYKIIGDVFYLFQTGEVKEVLSEPISAFNFLPGYVLLQILQPKWSS
jgi:hypothetical protein